MKIQAVLFDHDGTLADSEVVHYQFWASVLAKLDVAFPEEHYRQHYTGVSELNTAKHLREHFALQERVEDLVAAKRDQALQFHQTQYYPTLPHVEDTLAALRHAGIRMAVVSGSARFALEANLQAAGLRDYFEFIASGEEMPANKPAPDVYAWAVNQMGLPVEACVAVEDTFSGVSAAKAAGLFTCAIPNRFSAHQDFSRADLCFEAMDGFRHWLLDL